MLTRAALTLIDGYQNYISPKKGFGCAYRVLHGGDIGCSGYAKYALRDHGFWSALPLIRARFAACKVAAVELSSQRDTDDDAPKRKRRSGWGCLDGFCLAGEGCSGGRAARGTDKSGGCDAVDCTPDCGPCSCGS